MQEYIIETENLYFKYSDGTQALDDLSLKIKKNKKVAILGSNGAGKSTLFLHLNGILKPDKGKILFNGQEIKYNHKSLTELKKKIGIVFQDPDSQLFSASVYQEVSFGPMNLNLDKNIVKKLVDNAITATNINHLKNKPTHFLSYGEKKRVSIAGIIAMLPELIIFDEPTEFLDPKHKEQVMSLISKLSNDGATIVMSTHDINLAYEWADYMILLKDGKVIGEGTPDFIFSNKELIEKINFKLPLILDIYFDLMTKKILPKNSILPRNKQDLTQLIIDNAKNPHFVI